MHGRRMENAFRQCYPSGKSNLLRIVGFGLISLGLILLLFCVPWWAWIAIIGALLIAFGIILAK